MNRILTIAAAVALIAAPASAQSLRVSTLGKTTEQLHTDIAKAATTVCNRATISATFPREMFAACYKATMENAIAKAGNPDLAAAAGIKLAQR